MHIVWCCFHRTCQVVRWHRRRCWAIWNAWCPRKVRPTQQPSLRRTSTKERKDRKKGTKGIWEHIHNKKETKNGSCFRKQKTCLKAALSFFLFVCLSVCICMYIIVLSIHSYVKTFFRGILVYCIEGDNKASISLYTSAMIPHVVVFAERYRKHTKIKGSFFPSFCQTKLPHTYRFFIHVKRRRRRKEHRDKLRCVLSCFLLAVDSHVVFFSLSLVISFSILVYRQHSLL